MAQGKVEICGVNTAKLPVLGEKERGRAGKGRIYQRQSPAGLKCDQEIRRKQ